MHCDHKPRLMIPTNLFISDKVWYNQTNPFQLLPASSISIVYVGTWNLMSRDDVWTVQM
jgi:hypothetical protein